MSSSISSRLKESSFSSDCLGGSSTFFFFFFLAYEIAAGAGAISSFS